MPRRVYIPVDKKESHAAKMATTIGMGWITARNLLGWVFNWIGKSYDELPYRVTQMSAGHKQTASGENRYTTHHRLLPVVFESLPIFDTRIL